MKKTKEYDRNYIEEIVKNNNSFRGVGRKLEVDNKTAKRIILRYDVDYSHFKLGTGYHDMIGKKYHMLTVLNVYRIKSKSNTLRYKAKCLCDCGKEKDILAPAIKDGRTGSCGCDKSRYDRMRGKSSNLYKGYEKISGKMWNVITKSAKKRDFDFKINIRYIWELYLEQQGKCALSDVPIEFGSSSRTISSATASLDRIDSTKGYIKGNVQWVHKSVNIMKTNLPSSIFIGLCNRISNKCRENGELDIKILSANHFLGRGKNKFPEK